jgi:hypothetical protein
MSTTETHASTQPVPVQPETDDDQIETAFTALKRDLDAAKRCAEHIAGEMSELEMDLEDLREQLQDLVDRS